jgi:hypothetical protein
MEYPLLQSMSIENLNTVLDRRRRDVDMFSSLRSKDINENKRVEINQLLEIQKDVIAEVESIKKSKKKR